LAQFFRPPGVAGQSRQIAANLLAVLAEQGM